MQATRAVISDSRRKFQVLCHTNAQIYSVSDRCFKSLWPRFRCRRKVFATSCFFVDSRYYVKESKFLVLRAAHCKSMFYFYNPVIQLIGMAAFMKKYRLFVTTSLPYFTLLRCRLIFTHK